LVCRQGFVESRGMTPPCRRNILRLVLGYWRLREISRLDLKFADERSSCRQHILYVYIQ
jgi:hypothetical protein